jgi:hypothetical protein
MHTDALNQQPFANRVTEMVSPKTGSFKGQRASFFTQDLMVGYRTQSTPLNRNAERTINYEREPNVSTYGCHWNGMLVPGC